MVTIIETHPELNHPYLEKSLVESINTEYSTAIQLQRDVPEYHILKDRVIDTFVSNFCMYIQSHGVFDYYGIEDLPDLIDFAHSHRIYDYIPSDKVIVECIRKLNFVFVFGDEVINEPFESVW